MPTQAMKIKQARQPKPVTASSEIRGVVEVARRAGFGDDERMQAGAACTHQVLTGDQTMQAAN